MGPAARPRKRGAGTVSYAARALPDATPAPPSRRRTSPLFAKLLLSVGALVLTAGVLELGFRALGIRGYHAERVTEWEDALVPRDQVRPGLGLELRPGSEFLHRYDSDPRGRFGPDRTVRYRINRHGHRGPDFARRPREGVRRIALLGDSFAFGEGVAFEATMGEALERALSREDAPVEVLNLGVSAWSTHNEVAYLRQGALDFEPDLVLLVYVLNDAGYEVGLDLWNRFRESYEADGWWRRSWLVSWIRTRVARERAGRAYVEELVASARKHRDRWDRSLRGLSEARELVAARGARFAVVVFPFLFRLDAGHPFAELHELVVEHCRAEGIPVLDLLPSFLGRDYAELWVHPADQHPNEIAHAVAGRAMAEFVRAKGLLAGAEAAP